MSPSGERSTRGGTGNPILKSGRDLLRKKLVICAQNRYWLGFAIEGEIDLLKCRRFALGIRRFALGMKSCGSF
jgi:hypothetical protein